MTIAVNEKNRIYVGKIKLVRKEYNDEEKGWFRGFYNRFSPPVKEETVLREVLLKPGEIYNKRLERDSMRRLSQLGVFDNDKLKAYNEPTGEPGVHNMVIEAEEANTGSIGGGVGYGDVTGAFLFANFTEKNVGGRADALSIQGMLGTKNSSIVTSYLVRHLGDGENSLATHLYFQNQIAPGYLARTVGATTELGHPLDPEWMLFLRPRVEWVTLSQDTNFTHYKDIHENVEQSYGVATGRARVVQDTRYPFDGHYREGYLQGLSLEAGYAGGALVRLEAQRDQYLALTRSLTYRMNAFGGIMPYAASTLPIQERYFLGGDTDMRGFKYRGAGYFDSGNDQAPIGGAAKLLVKNEVLYPIYDPVSGVAFVDVGMLGESPVHYQGPRVSTGLGLRFDLKSVQVALDFALPVLTQTSDEKRYFHFSLQGQL
jgi:outer membrane protein insertion porin family